jgi:hypothetical protein
VGSRLREGYDASKEELARRYRRAEGTFARNPSSSVLIGFGIGFGVGLALTTILVGREETWAERYLPDSLRDLPENVRRSRLARSVQDAQLPDSVHNTLEQLASSLKDLPSAIARVLPRH